MMGNAGSDTKLLGNYQTMLGHHKSYRKPEALGAPTFVVCHYAGDVEYDVDGFVEKNKDTVSVLIKESLTSSKSSVIQ
jgi:myosin heavy subunit